MRIEGFEPVFDGNSRVLILGSFPSVKSRAEGFYYGNPQNRFWRAVCGFFGEEPPATVEKKREFLLRRGIALWDVVESCEIVGSADASISAPAAADIPRVARGEMPILCNGATAYRLLIENFPELAPRAQKLPSTSPANPRFSGEAWHTALSHIFPKGSAGAREFSQKG